MQITRHGASADFGESSIEFKTPGFSWNKTALCLTINQLKVKDFSTDSRHNYSISLSLAEVQSLLLALSDAATSDPTTFEKGLDSSLKPLIRLQAVVAGTVG